ncbi:MAG TPA: response regulator transcription factor [Roseiflexaceae bacterium]|nr:response regulator transcription factor [Roseiflexaceae bacterium]
MDTNSPGVDPIRVLVVDDHAVSREALLFGMETHPDLLPVGEARDGAEALACVRELDGAVDVIVMDVQMNGPNDGIDTAAALHAEWPECRIVLLTSSEQHVPAALRAGVMGYVLKGSRVQQVLAAIRAVHQGVFHFEVAPNLGTVLADTEVQVLDLVADGYANTEIAGKLGWSVRAVTAHVSAILRKLNARGREHAVRLAMRQGIIR